MNALPQQPGAAHLGPASDSTSHHRCDSAHHSEATSPGKSAAPPDLPEAELLQRQARQLEEHLKERLRELDRREAQIHASCAQLESDLRIARMWWLDHQRELQEHEQLPSRQEQRPGYRKTRRTVVTPAATQPLDLDKQQLTDLAALRINLGLADSPVSTEEQVHPLPHNTAENQRDIHEPTLHSALEDLAQHASQLQADQRALAQERLAWQQERIDQETKLKHREQQLEERTTRVAQRLWQRRSLLSRMNKTAADWHEQAMRRHRESLELRLVAEQLYHDLQVTVPAGQLRNKRQAAHQQLEQHYRDRETAVQQRQMALDQRTVQLHQQQAELAKQRTAILHAAESRHLELAQLTARLVEREHQLAQREQLLLQQRHTWKNNQYQHQQTLYQLLKGNACAATPPSPGSSHRQ
ncbi:MAG: hypothetical protein VX346_18690 [Planctomycetota bacterium]|nr:hypothetical protein [Planctomycetota bacterium]